MNPFPFIIFIIFLIVPFNTKPCKPKIPTIILKNKEIIEIRKAQIYLQKQLYNYEHKKGDYYTLYLAVKNYQHKLE